MPPPADSPLGLIPAAGRGTRMGRLPCSKEILPVGLDRNGDVHTLIDLLLGHFHNCRVQGAVLAVAPHKNDIPEYLGNSFGDTTDPRPLNYVEIDSPSTVHSIDACYSLIRGKDILLGFPDIVLPDGVSLQPLRQRLREDNADLVLGLFPTDQPSRVDMVEVDANGGVTGLLIKQATYPATYRHTWAAAAWRPVFSDFLHTQLTALNPEAGELYVGDVIRAALDDGFKACGAVLSNSPSVDAGTPESYRQVLAQRLAG